MYAIKTITGRHLESTNTRTQTEKSQLVARVVLQTVLLRLRHTIPSRFVPPLLGPTATDDPLDARQRCPIVVRTSFAKPHEGVTVKSAALLSLHIAHNINRVD